MHFTVIPLRHDESLFYPLRKTLGRLRALTLGASKRSPTFVAETAIRVVSRVSNGSADALIHASHAQRFVIRASASLISHTFIEMVHPRPELRVADVGVRQTHHDDRRSSELILKVDAFAEFPPTTHSNTAPPFRAFVSKPRFTDAA